MFRSISRIGSLSVSKSVSSANYFVNISARQFSGNSWHGTTILCVRKNGKVVMGGDGQVSMGSSVVKGNARKVRKIGDGVLVGFAGSTADAMSLLERLEKKLDEHPGQLMRACTELAKLWRSDKYLRRLEVRAIKKNYCHHFTMCTSQATLLVADATHSFELTGNGDVLEPEYGAIGFLYEVT